MPPLRSAVRGFTLVELLIVIVVIGIIAALVLVRFSEAKSSAYRDAMLNDLRNFAMAQELHQTNHQAYAESLDSLEFAFSRDVSADSMSADNVAWFLRVQHAKLDEVCWLGSEKSEAQRLQCSTAEDGDQDEHDPTPNSPPAAGSMSWEPEHPVTGTEITFQASGWSDPEGDLLSYAWSFGNGDVAAGAETRYTFEEAGLYEITLTADDGRGGISSIVDQVDVPSPSLRDLPGIPPGAVAIWDPADLSNGAQYLTDMSGNGNHCVFGPSALDEDFDPVRSASSGTLSFPGTAQSNAAFLDCGNMPELDLSTGALTAVVAVQTADNSGKMAMLIGRTAISGVALPMAPQWGIGYDDDQTRFIFGQHRGNSRYSASATFQQDSWNTLTLVLRDSKPWPFVNGVARTINWGYPFQVGQPNNRVLIGKLRYDGTYHSPEFARSSVVGPILVYDRALSADSVGMAHDALREWGQSQGKPYGALPPAPQP